MAYSCVSVSFEIGHEASIRTKRTPEGFTHDWEVFVRGADNTEINHFVEKVVFHLHETFTKPKRVVKEPPYSVKESGYAGFNLPIDVYFKNHDEPKKVRFNYDLHLQTSGPPISNVLREKYVFPNPAEDLRRRLIKGGGVGVVGLEASLHLASTEKSSITATSGEDASLHKHSVPVLVGKPKLGGDTSKKHKVKEYKAEEPRVSSSFADLFGTPIKTAKVSPDPKKPSHSPKVSPVPKGSKPADKSSSEKQVSATKSAKQFPQKEPKDSERSSSSSSTKDEKKDKSKERDKNKEKPPKRSCSPPKHPSTPPKRPPSPPKRSSTPPKRPTTPPKSFPTPSKCLSTSPKQSTTPKSSKNESKKSTSDEGKGKSDSKTESSKSEKKKKDKKNRDEKPKKDKHKEYESKTTDKVGKSEKSSKESKDKDPVKKVEKDPAKEVDKSREKEREKSRHNDGDKEKQRHKHKKKDKSSKDRDKEKDKDREKSGKKSSEIRSSEVRNGVGTDIGRNSGDGNSDTKKQAAHSPSPNPVKPSPTSDKPASSSGLLSKDKLAKRPLDVLLKNVPDDSSDSNLSADSDDDLEPSSVKIKSMKPTSAPESCMSISVETKTTETSVLGSSTKTNNKTESSKPKSEISNQERNSLSKSNSKSKDKSLSRKSKEKEVVSADIDKDIKAERDVSKKRKRKISGKGEEGESCRNNGETAPKLSKLDPEPAEQDVMVVEQETEQVATTQLTEEYVSQLKELQHKIMTLEDNAELQRVVQVIAETGQYEITKKTFDFDLCALDRSTVQRLQDFFTPS